MVWIKPFAGNHVIIEADGFNVFAAHLRSGSVQVEVGDKIKVGQVLGEVGNSGLALEPHLHVQLVDRVDDLLAANVPPFRIDAFEVMTNGTWKASLDGILPKGEIARFN